MTSPLVTALELASRDWTGGPPGGEMLTATRAFLAGVEQNPSLTNAAAVAMGRATPPVATWLAVVSGTAVERGADAGATGPAVFSRLRHWLPQLPAWTEPADEHTEIVYPEPTAAQAVLLELLPMLCQAVVTHLARLPAQREEMSRDLALRARLEQVGAYSHGAIWVREALMKWSGPLVLLHPSSRGGHAFRVVNVANNFHLFSLLQSAAGFPFAAGRAANSLVARVARGKSSECVSDEAWWHYGDPRSPTADLAHSIWGEGWVRDIPEIDGARVVLAWPAILQGRSWDEGFLGPHLEAMPADVVTERALSDAEVGAWFDQLGIGATRKWWPFK
jgi:hypothetical protein